MPVPVSRTAIFNCWPAGASARVIDTSIDPPSVYLTEFSIRFDSTWRSSLRSERIVRSCGSTCCAIAIRLAAIFSRNGSSTSASSDAMPTVSRSARRFVERSLM